MNFYIWDDDENAYFGALGGHEERNTYTNVLSMAMSFETANHALDFIREHLFFTDARVVHVEPSDYEAPV
jgi:hypothetical protein